jgi:hypothetical protein
VAGDTVGAINLNLIVVLRLGKCTEENAAREQETAARMSANVNGGKNIGERNVGRGANVIVI